MAPIHLAGFDRTCKQIQTIFRKLFCSIIKYVKKTNNDYLDIIIMHFTHLEAPTIPINYSELFYSFLFHLLVLENLDDGSTNKLFILVQKIMEWFISIFFQQCLCSWVFFKGYSELSTYELNWSCIKLFEITHQNSQCLEKKQPSCFDISSIKSLHGTTLSNRFLAWVESPFANTFNCR